jgi:hypothetical protein
MAKCGYCSETVARGDAQEFHLGCLLDLLRSIDELTEILHVMTQSHAEMLAEIARLKLQIQTERLQGKTFH